MVVALQTARIIYHWRRYRAESEPQAFPFCVSLRFTWSAALPKCPGCTTTHLTKRARSRSALRLIARFNGPDILWISLRPLAASLPPRDSTKKRSITPRKLRRYWRGSPNRWILWCTVIRMRNRFGNWAKAIIKIAEGWWVRWRMANCHCILFLFSTLTVRMR